MILSTGPLTGTGVPGSIRFDITACSPKSGLPTSSNCGGSFSLYLKRAAYDALILTSVAKPGDGMEMVYLRYSLAKIKK